ncbi:MAG TPA: hypothetical protein VK082_05430 [Paenalcaligenes sp.]|nr:hypothetical protein [Paenalcaligenes sp.]
MLKKTFIAASLSVLLAACQTTTPPNQRMNVDDVVPPPPSQNQGAQQQGQSGQQQAQSVITIHLAQEQADDQLVAVDVGDGNLYALPQPVLVQSDMQQVTPVTAENGSTFLLIEMTDEGRQKLAAVSERAQGHYLLLSVQGQLVSLAQIGQPLQDGELLMGTQSQQHTDAILDMMRGQARQNQ